MPSLLEPRRRKIGPLQAIEFSAPEGSAAIVCLHGYGADARDLASLALELDLAAPARWIFPDAPLALPSNYFGPGRAWFPIDQARMMRAQTGEEAFDLSRSRPQGFDEALSALEEFLGSLGEPRENLILGGFSQGAMLAAELALRVPSPPRGLFLLSAALVDEPRLQDLAPGRRGLAFFQSHGRQDALLSYEGALHLNELLLKAGLIGGLFSFEGGHALPPEACRALRGYLNSRLGPTA
ncbi:MAG: alpha/beta fold hydrolase [Elusimicrobia bacterium]|nr:alpha/beta fold hydrolase [Elusimicrobiota bacterium]